MSPDYDAIVVGAGVIGVFTAWALQARGLSVCLIDRDEGPARQTSAANAGVIAPGYVAPFASPGAARKAFLNLFEADRAFSWMPSKSPSQWRWLAQWLAQGTSLKYQQNRAAMFALAHFSQGCLHAIADGLGLAYRSVAHYHVIFRTKHDFDRSEGLRHQLKLSGLEHTILKREALFELEPALADADLQIEAALRVQGDEAGDCAGFVEHLCERLITGGAQWMGAVDVSAIRVKPEDVSQCVLADGRSISAKHLVLAAGPWSKELLECLELRLPIYPIRGFSLTWDQDAMSPSAKHRVRALGTALMDDRYKIALTPLHHGGPSSLRAAGMALLGPPSAHEGIGIDRQREAADTLWRIATQWFEGLEPLHRDPKTADAPPSPRFWMGSRPMLPDGLPLIGRLLGAGKRGGLWINSGHGSTGWAMAAGSAYLLADQMLGLSPELEQRIRHEAMVVRPASRAYDLDARRFCPSRWLGRRFNTR